MEMTFQQQVLLQLLDWQFLLLFGFLVVCLIFWKDLRRVIQRGGITLEWGDKKFTVDKLPAKHEKHGVWPQNQECCGKLFILQRRA